MNVFNIVVFITRWFGGIQLGPDRHKHIITCCREILEENLQLIKRDENNESEKRDNMKKK